MKKTNCLLTLSVAALCAAGRAYAVGTAPAVLSNYGEIQSVKNYSSNPFWNKNSPYNQNFPKPIYATGADLNTGDCNRVVENLVAAYCVEHNYCRNLRISDVRPTIMVQLSQLPGHNFATSCGGYIDSTFDKFQKEYGNTSTANLPKPASQPTNVEIANPFAPKQTAEQRAVADRTAELEQLQSITTPTAGVHAEYFPKTTADLSFTDRLANTAAGYEPYKDLESYKKPDFLGEDEEFFNRLRAQNFEKFCERRPENPECVKWYCEQHPDDEKCKKGNVTTPPTDPNPVVNPPATGCPEIADHRDPKTCKCYPSDFMDSTDCKCRGKISTWDTTNHKCVCPISTANLAIEEWAYVTTMCQCPSTKPNYNAKTHLCEKDGTPPPPSNDGKTYALLQCRSKRAVLQSDLNNILPTDDPFGALGCSENFHASINKCFTPCVSKVSHIPMPGGNITNAKGFVNSISESEIGRKFCAGQRYHADGSGTVDFVRAVGFFSEQNPDLGYSAKNTPMSFTNIEIDKIKKKILANQNNDNCDTSNHWYWMVYVLRQNQDGKWQPIEAITLYHK